MTQRFKIRRRWSSFLNFCSHVAEIQFTNKNETKRKSPQTSICSAVLDASQSPHIPTRPLERHPHGVLFISRRSVEDGSGWLVEPFYWKATKRYQTEHRAQHGRVEGVEDRINALAEALGVPSKDLARAIAGAVREYVPPASLSALKEKETGSPVVDELLKEPQGNSPGTSLRGGSWDCWGRDERCRKLCWHGRTVETRRPIFNLTIFSILVHVYVSRVT